MSTPLADWVTKNASWSCSILGAGSLKTSAWTWTKKINLASAPLCLLSMEVTQMWLLPWQKGLNWRRVKFWSLSQWGGCQQTLYFWCHCLQCSSHNRLVATSKAWDGQSRSFGSLWPFPAFLWLITTWHFTSHANRKSRHCGDFDETVGLWYQKGEGWL